MDHEFSECVVCGVKIAGITLYDFKLDEERTRLTWDFCPNHAILAVGHCLPSGVVMRMREIAGCETFATHDDFYDEVGNAVQPKI